MTKFGSGFCYQFCTKNLKIILVKNNKKKHLFKTIRNFQVNVFLCVWQGVILYLCDVWCLGPDHTQPRPEENGHYRQLATGRNFNSLLDFLDFRKWKRLLSTSEEYHEAVFRFRIQRPSGSGSHFAESGSTGLKKDIKCWINPK